MKDVIFILIIVFILLMGLMSFLIGIDDSLIRERMEIQQKYEREKMEMQQQYKLEQIKVWTVSTKKLILFFKVK